MKINIAHIKNLIALVLLLSVMSCKTEKSTVYNLADNFKNILDIHYTPNDSIQCNGCFTDNGSWMGFTIPQEEKWINGFCGPFSLEKRYWVANCAVKVGLEGEQDSAFQPDSTNYEPSKCFISSSSPSGKVEQE